MASTDPNLGLTYGWTLGESNWHTGMDANLKRLGALVGLSVIDRTTTTPPASPSNGDRYIIPPGATGAWSGKTDQIAVRIEGAWEYHVPQPGWIAYIVAEDKLSVYTSTGWSTRVSSAIVSEVVGLVQVETGGAGSPLKYQRVDGNFTPIIRSDNAWFNWHPTYMGITTQIVDNQYMVRIPKFYFKAGTVPSGPYAGKAYWMISPTPVSGFSVHPAFIGAGGVEMDQIWVGKYQASYDGSSKAQSIPGVLPMVNLDFPTARARAYARNTGGVTGFRLWSIYDLSAIQMLATIEMGGLDMQSLIGQGRVSQTFAANVDASDVAQATWRGIVGLWGNVWQMTDGIKRNGGNWHRWQYNVPGSTTTNDFSTGYVDTGQSALTTIGFPVTFNTSLLESGIIVPDSLTGTYNNGSTGDHFWSNAGTDDRVWHHGASWEYGTYAGLFCATLTDQPTILASYISARLAKV
jgi:hypothetical protein